MEEITEIKPLHREWGTLKFEEIVEVYETPKRAEANKYLASGYKLIGVYPFATPVRAEGAVVVRKFVSYVLGRTGDVEHFDVEIESAPASSETPPTEAPAE